MPTYYSLTNTHTHTHTLSLCLSLFLQNTYVAITLTSVSVSLLVFLSFSIRPHHLRLDPCPLVYNLIVSVSFAKTPSLTPSSLGYCLFTPTFIILPFAIPARPLSLTIYNRCIKFVFCLILSPQSSWLRKALIAPPSWRFLRSTVPLQHMPNPPYLHCLPICSQIRI